MDEDDECNALRQVLEKKCPRAKFRGEDIKKLVDAGYDTEVALMAATKDSLDRVLPTRPDVVDLLVKAFVQSRDTLPWAVWVDQKLLRIAYEFLSPSWSHEPKIAVSPNEVIEWNIWPEVTQYVADGLPNLYVLSSKPL